MPPGPAHPGHAGGHICCRTPKHWGKRCWAQVVGGGCHLDRHTLDTLEATFDSVTVLGVKDSPLVPVVYGTARKKQ